MPWPLASRDILIRSSGQYNEEKKAILTVIKSIDSEKYFGVDIPAPANGNVRLDFHKGYHYFEYIDDKRSRYVSIFNVNPHLSYFPNWLINHLLSKICYEEMV